MLLQTVAEPGVQGVLKPPLPPWLPTNFVEEEEGRRKFCGGGRRNERREEEEGKESPLDLDPGSAAGSKGQLSFARTKR